VAEVDVSFDAPDREWSGRLSRPTVNCYLYDVRENHEFRETDYELERRSSGVALRTKTPIRVDVSYQVTVWARAAEDEHRLLWRVMSALLRHPRLPDDVLQGELKDQPFPIRAQSAQPELGPKNAAELWQALDNRIRPGLTYMVTLALDPQVVITSPLVFTRSARLFGWPEHPPQNDTPASEALQIGGWVRDRRHPEQGVAQARVRMRETGAETISDENGRFMFRHVRQGAATLVVEAPGRRSVTRRMTIPAPSYEIEI
jgi:hypothetical protein